MCKELDDYLTELEKVHGLGAITQFAKKAKLSRISLWRFRTGKQKPSMRTRKTIKRLTFNVVMPEHFNTIKGE